MAFTASTPTPTMANPPRLRHQEVLAGEGEPWKLKVTQCFRFVWRKPRFAQEPNAQCSSDQGAMRKSIAREMKSLALLAAEDNPSEGAPGCRPRARRSVDENNNIGAVLHDCMPSCSSRKERISVAPRRRQRQIVDPTVWPSPFKIDKVALLFPSQSGS